MEVRNLAELLENIPCNKTIADSYIKAYQVLKNHDSAICAVSGGSDSDVVVDMIQRIDINKTVDYVWFDTGLESVATKEQLNYLEERYDIKIERIRAIKPIPLSCKEYGEPFISKYASEMIYRLQLHGFKWEDKPYDELIKEYDNCVSALQWWCNKKSPAMNINQNKYLKEFMIQNNPDFKVSNKCCDYAKKDVVRNYIKANGYSLDIIGIRKAEGGVRSIQYKSCFDNGDGTHDTYRPLFWYTNSDKNEYEQFFHIQHSRCYTEYGLPRTGCMGCPYSGRNLENELAALQQHEPNLYKGVCNVFKNSYEYTRQYREFVREMDMRKGGQMTLDDFIRSD